MVIVKMVVSADILLQKLSIDAIVYLPHEDDFPALGDRFQFQERSVMMLIDTAVVHAYLVIWSCLLALTRSRQFPVNHDLDKGASHSDLHGHMHQFPDSALFVYRIDCS